MHMKNKKYSNKISFETYLSKGGVRGGLGAMAPSSEHPSPHRKVEIVFFELFNSYITLLKVFSPLVERVSPLSKNSLRHPYICLPSILDIKQGWVTNITLVT